MKSCWWWNIAAQLWTWEKSTEQSVGLQRRKPASNRKKYLYYKKVPDTIFFQLKWNRATKKSCEEHLWEILQKVCACWGQPFLLESSTEHWNAWYQASSWWHICSQVRARVSPRRERWSFASPFLLSLPHLTRSCSYTSRNVLLDENSIQGRPLNQPFSSLSTYMSKIEFKRTFLQWLETAWKCVVPDGHYFETLQSKKGEHTSCISHENEAPLQ